MKHETDEERKKKTEIAQKQATMRQQKCAKQVKMEYKAERTKQKENRERRRRKRRREWGREEWERRHKRVTCRKRKRLRGRRNAQCQHRMRMRMGMRMCDTWCCHLSLSLPLYLLVSHVCGECWLIVVWR